MIPPQFPDSVNSEMEALHLPDYCFPDHALAGRKPAVGVALHTINLPCFGDFARVDAFVHCGTKAVEVRPGSRWNLFC